jgi:hypothetical protein
MHWQAAAAKQRNQTPHDLPGFWGLIGLIGFSAHRGGLPTNAAVPLASSLHVYTDVGRPPVHTALLQNKSGE